MAKMNILSQILFSLLSISLFLSTSAAAPRGLQARDQPSLAKRAPPEIENWPLYRAWADLLSDGELGVPAIPNVEEGTLEGKTLVYVGETGNCEKRTTMEESVAALYTAVFRGELVTIKQDGTQSKQEVAIKRARGNMGDLVLYGGTVQKQFSDNNNILPLIDYLVAGRYKYIILPWVSGKSLEQNFGAFSGPDAVNEAFKQILNAVSALHSAGYMHRDLKPENLLNDGGTLKLMDFDHTTQQSSSLEFGVGTATYAAPEVIAMRRLPTGGEGYNKQVDVFSIGMTYLVMSESSLQNSDNRFLLWKELIEPDGKLWPSVDQVAKILAAKNYKTFSGNSNLLQVIAKALCSPTERYADAGEFQSAFGGAV